LFPQGYNYYFLKKCPKEHISPKKEKEVKPMDLEEE